MVREKQGSTKKTAKTPAAEHKLLPSGTSGNRCCVLLLARVAQVAGNGLEPSLSGPGLLSGSAAGHFALANDENRICMPFRTTARGRRDL
jgi:hypothetical protein